MRKVPVSTLALLAALAILSFVVSVPVHAQTYSVLYNFGINSGDPTMFEGIIAQGRDGNLYTTATHGGANGDGAVFKITPAGKLTVLYSFCSQASCADGDTPVSGLTLGREGDFYGATALGGTLGYGNIFKITPAGGFTVLYNFTGGSDGSHSDAAPIQGTDGNFYGTSSGLGGATCGSIYKISPAGVLTPLFAFDSTHGCNPFDALALGTDGNFYGTTPAGGDNNLGVVFKVTPAGKLTVLHSFDGTNGSEPLGPLVQGSDGNFYGTTYSGGGIGAGTVFKVTPTGTLTVLHFLNGTTDGSHPQTGVVQATDGNFYGVSTNGGTSTNCSGGCGTIFKVTPTGSYSVLYDFDNTTGSSPFDLVQHTNGLLYGGTYYGGAAGDGVFYSLNANLPAFVRLLPYSGKVGSAVEFLGQGFTSSTTVSFNGTAASFTVLSSTYLTATVPAGAITGPITVVTTSAHLMSNQRFRVTPQILSFSPTSGPVGTQVVITGVSLTQTTKVTFGGVAATTFVVGSDSQVTATVPTGAATGKIMITTAGGTATSSAAFTVTP